MVALQSPNDLTKLTNQIVSLFPQVHQASSNPLGSGLGYLEHICQLIEKIGQLQEHNLRLQKQICGLQKDGRLTKTKEVSHIQTILCAMGPWEESQVKTSGLDLCILSKIGFRHIAFA